MKYYTAVYEALSKNMGVSTTLELMNSPIEILVTASIEANFNKKNLKYISCRNTLVAFGIVGLPDIIVNSKNNFLAQKDIFFQFSHCIIESPNDKGGINQFVRKNALESSSYCPLVFFSTPLYQ